MVSTLAPAAARLPASPVATADKPGVLQVAGVKTAPPLSTAEKAGQPGSSPNVTTQAGRGGVEVNATGAMAQGLEVEQTSPGGLVTAQCGAPGTSFWFVGPGQASAGTIELYLMNTGSQPADAQVSVLTDVTKGPPLLGNADNGITVPPHGMVVQSLRPPAPVVEDHRAECHHQRRPGSRGSPGEPVRKRGGNWLPATQAPARHLVIPGLPRASGSRQLYIAVPGSAHGAGQDHRGHRQGFLSAHRRDWHRSARRVGGLDRAAVARRGARRDHASRLPCRSLPPCSCRAARPAPQARSR